MILFFQPGLESNSSNSETDNNALYKGKRLTRLGQDLWALEGQGVRIICEGGLYIGWKARIDFSGDSSKRPLTYGRILERVIDEILKDETSRLRGARSQLDAREKMLSSLEH